MKYFLPTGSIDRIDLCVTSIEVHPHPPPIFHFVQSNTLKSVLSIEKLAVGQQIIFSRSIMT